MTHLRFAGMSHRSCVSRSERVTEKMRTFVGEKQLTSMSEAEIHASGGLDSARRRVAVVSSTRADWGLLCPVVKGLIERDDTDVRVIAANMHLEERYGMTVNEIEADGVKVWARVPMPSASSEHADDAPGLGAALGAAECLGGMAHVLAGMRPDLLLLLGDRYEMLAVASAATIMRVPVVHIAGGEISEGAIDDSIRHAITKLASLHLTATEENRRRVISMGEEEERVINTGAIGVHNFINGDSAPVAELEELTGISIGRSTLLVTFHPATLDSEPAATRIDALLEALDRFPQSGVIFTYPNNDPDGAVIIERINAYAKCRNSDAAMTPVAVIPSLGRRRYLGALRCVGAVVGNSSSGIVEVPSAGIPTVDIGIRQRGRLCGASVIHCGDSAGEITSAIAYALSPEGQRMAREATNPYCRPDTLELMVKAIAETPLEKLHGKRFVDRFPKP